MTSKPGRAPGQRREPSAPPSPGVLLPASVQDAGAPSSSKRVAATHCHGCGAELPPAKKHGHRRKWCSERCRKQTLYSTACVDCGGPTTGDGSYHKRCQTCNGIRGAERNRAEWEPYQRMIEEMWAEGMTAREIGQAIGSTAKRINIGRYRSRGYNLPHRRTPEQIERICADKGAHLAKAREVWRAQREAA